MNTVPRRLSPAYLSLLLYMSALPKHLRCPEQMMLFMQDGLILQDLAQYISNLTSAQCSPSCQNTLLFLPQNLSLYIVIFAFLVSSLEDHELHDSRNAFALGILSS